MTYEDVEFPPGKYRFAYGWKNLDVIDPDKPDEPMHFERLTTNEVEFEVVDELPADYYTEVYKDGWDEIFDANIEPWFTDNPGGVAGTLMGLKVQSLPFDIAFDVYAQAEGMAQPEPVAQQLARKADSGGNYLFWIKPGSLTWDNVGDKRWRIILKPSQKVAAAHPPIRNYFGRRKYTTDWLTFEKSDRFDQHREMFKKREKEKSTNSELIYEIDPNGLSEKGIKDLQKRAIENMQERMGSNVEFKALENGKIEIALKSTNSQNYTVTLPNGTTVELVGTCQYTESGPSCYRPDGNPLGRQLRISKWNKNPKAGDVGIMLKLDGPADTKLSYHEIEGAKGWEGSCHVVDENGQELKGYEAALTHFDPEQKTTSCMFGIASGTWKTIAKHDGKQIGIDNDISFTKANQTDRGVQIFTTDTLGRNIDQRIVAIDIQGKLHPWQGQTGSVRHNELRQSIGTFPDLTLEQIKEFQFQTRSYDWVHFKNVSLRPGGETEGGVWVAKSTSSEPTTKNSIPVSGPQSSGKEKQKVLPDGTSVSDVVNNVRNNENWIHDVDSFYLEVKGLSPKTQPGMMMPMMGSSPSAAETLEFAFDKNRVRFMCDDPLWYQLMIWNGNEVIGHEKSSQDDGEFYYFHYTPQNRFKNFISSWTSWLRSQPHSFWFDLKDTQALMELYGRAEDFYYTETTQYQGVKCYVLSCDKMLPTLSSVWYVGVDDGLLYGIKKFKDGELWTEGWLGDFKEVASGCWAPFTMGSKLYHHDEEGTLFLDSRRELKVVQCTVNQELSDDLFKIDFKDGIKVNDHRFGNFMTYPYKASRTQQEWQELIMQSAVSNPVEIEIGESESLRPGGETDGEIETQSSVSSPQSSGGKSEWVVKNDSDGGVADRPQIAIEAKVFAAKVTHAMVAEQLKAAGVEVELNPQGMLSFTALTDAQSSALQKWMTSTAGTSALTCPKVRVFDGEQTQMGLMDTQTFTTGYENDTPKVEEITTGTQFEFTPMYQKEDDAIRLKLAFDKTMILDIMKQTTDSGKEIEIPTTQTKSFCSAIAIPQGKTMLVPVAGTGGMVSMSNTVPTDANTPKTEQIFLLIKTEVEKQPSVPSSQSPGETIVDWKTVSESYQVKPEVDTQGGTSATDYGTVSFGNAYEKEGAAFIEVTDTIDRDVYEVRFVAIDKNDNAIKRNGGGSGSFENITRNTARFDTTLKDTKVFRVQIRSVEKMKNQN